MASHSVGFPKQIKYIVGNEACERFSFYGMRSILVIFMVHQLAMAENRAAETFHIFVAAVYLLPLLGAFLADRLWGKYKTIMYLSIVYCAGHACLAMFEGSVSGLYWGLGLIALGSGGIKPCVSAYVGDQFDETNKQLISKVYDWFYFSINFGSFFSTLMIPWILPKYGASVAFGIPGVLMGIATVIFWMGRKNYVNIRPAKSGDAGFMAILGYSLANIAKKKRGQSLLDIAREKYSEKEVEAAKAAAAIFWLFILVCPFWALYDQQGSSWVLQGDKMNKDVLGIHIEASQIQAINPILIMAFIPLFGYVIYPAIEKYTGFKMTALRRMVIGMFVTGASFVSLAVCEVALHHGQISIAWQFVPYFFITAAEIMVSITGLEFAYTQAPPSMKSTIMSFWLLTIFAGNLLTATVEAWNKFQGVTYFMFFGILMFIVAGIFAIAAARFKVREYVSTAAEHDEALASNPGLNPEPTPAS